MIKMYKLLLSLLIILSTYIGFSQDIKKSSNSTPKKIWFVNAEFGVQMSGIKDEDFISKNVAPAISFGVGLWFTPEIAMRVSYKGPYFNTIADDDQHYYNYTYGEVLFNITEMIQANNSNRKWNLIVHPGAGFFNNMYYGRPNVCLNLGMINSLKVSKQMNIYIDISAIAGWDIYQGNDDILPNITIGMSYSFKKNH